MEIKRGGIYYVDLNPTIGSEQNGVRPCLVLQNDMGNKYSSTVIVATITSKIKGELPTHVHVEGTGFLPKNSCVQLEQLPTIDKIRIIEYLGILSEK